MKWLGLDIGGANIKVADGLGYAHSHAFGLWREPAALPQYIRTAISEAPPCDHLAVTMTGELADCFDSKKAGVQFILQSVAKGSDNRHTRVYLIDGRMVTPQVALAAPQLASASNWHALARFAGRHAPAGAALLIDVGSTTCDIIPLLEGKPVAVGKSDTERLLAGELIYTGVERSPVCAVAQQAPYRGQTCPIVHETFATTRDVYLLLDQLPENSADHHTADGKPATKNAARKRIGRMIAADEEEFNHRDAVALAQSVARAQLRIVAAAIGKVRGRMSTPPTRAVLSGHGEFLAEAALEAAGLKVTEHSLSNTMGPLVSRAATAHAVAVVAREMTSS